jgi:DNA-3-methyladenine glycosylase II
VHQTFDFVMTEHAAWLAAGETARRVFASPDGSRWLVQVTGAAVTQDRLTPDAADLQADVFTLPDGLAGLPAELIAALGGLGVVARFRNADLWDAIGMAIIRQVIRAAQSRKLYRAFCESHGERVTLPHGGTYPLFPAPETVHRLSDQQFAAIGMAFKGGALRNAASTYMEHGEKWRELAPLALAQELQSVPRIGPWTAHAAVADYGNDWSLYPYADLAVRTWARRAAPSHAWPDDEPSFGRAWRALAGPHLSSLTLLTLAWGSQHGDIG